MRKEKIAVYSLTAILFSLMMLAYWLLKLNSWNPYKLGIEVLFILLIARSGGNIALLFFGNKISIKIVAGIMAILLFLPIVIRSEALSVLIVLFAPVFTIMIIYAFFKKRTLQVLLNVIRILVAGFSAPALYFLFLCMIGKSNPQRINGDAGVGFFYLIFAMGIGIIELIALLINYEHHKNEAKVGKQAQLDPLQTK
jgi:hypothetical protein